MAGQGQGVHMIRTESISSSAISKASYDDETQEMQIVFTNGGPYTFYGVPQEIFEGLLFASSPGRYYHSVIKGNYD